MIVKVIRYVREYGCASLFHKIWFKLGRVIDASDYKYNSMARRNLPSNVDLQSQRTYRFSEKPLVSIVVPTYNTPPRFLEEFFDSVLAQTYENWELCVADGDSTNPDTQKIIRQYARKDSRIRPVFLDKNEGISANTNEAIGHSSGQLIVFSDHDDLLTPDALFEIVKSFSDDKADLVYSDEDKIDEKSKKLFKPNFKPDFSLDYLRTTNYMCHVVGIRKDKLLKIGCLDGRYDGSQDHDLMLRAVENDLVIKHIPKVLYHWREFSKSLSNANNDKCRLAARNAVQAHLDRLQINACVSEQSVGNRVRYEIAEQPRVSVIAIGSSEKNHGVQRSSYPNVEYCEDYTMASGEYIVFINLELVPDQDDWIEELLMYSQLEGVGAVGGAYFTYDRRVIHRGLHFEDSRLCYSFAGRSEFDPCYMNKALCVHNVSAVDGMFCMTKKEKFQNFLSEQPEGNFVQYCLWNIEKERRIVYTPYASAHMKKGAHIEYLRLMENSSYTLPFKEDPYYNWQIGLYIG